MAQSRGFTLIELLVVIAILGILAAAVLIAVNPFERLAQTRDSGRKDSISFLGRATAIYYTSKLNIQVRKQVGLLTILIAEDLQQTGQLIL